MVQRDFFTNAVYGQDQLRQRVAWALSQILVTSANEQDLSVRLRDVALPEHPVRQRVRQLRDAAAAGVAVAGDGQLPRRGQQRPRPTATGACRTRTTRARSCSCSRSASSELKEDGTPLTDGCGNADPDVRPGRHQGNRARLHRLDVRQPGRLARPTKKNGVVLRAADGAVPGTATTGHDVDPKTLLDDDGAAGRPDDAAGPARAPCTTCSCIPNTPVFIASS